MPSKTPRRKRENAIGKLVKYARQQEGLSQRGLELLTGVKNETICQIETGHSQFPSFESIVLLCRALDFPVGVLADTVKSRRKPAPAGDREMSEPKMIGHSPDCACWGCINQCASCRDKQAELDRLRAEVERLWEALERVDYIRERVLAHVPHTTVNADIVQVMDEVRAILASTAPKTEAQ